ncbi:MAG: NAD(P)-dependent oxidoreductase [Chthonomonadales bacterium]|nr:NAD(P)-dependent oxidoreductase [Chthonomonadales bacterium]
MANRAGKGAPPASVEELEERLSRPTKATVRAAERLGGDVVVLGAGGKMGPSLARLLLRSIAEAGASHRVVCVSRFGDAAAAEALERDGARVVRCDLLEPGALDALPDAPNVLYLAGTKFGSSSTPALTWAMNCLLPALAAERYRSSRIVALSTGNVYPFVSPRSGGATERTRPDPVGEYAQSCLGRERMFEYVSARSGARVLLARLNYATDLRYGVLADIARTLAAGRPVDVTMGWLNTIWQGDANAVLVRALDHCASPPMAMNLTGPRILSVREVAVRLAGLMGCPPPAFAGEEAPAALLSNPTTCTGLYGLPSVSEERIVEWTAHWVAAGLPSLDRPTHWETRDGRF